ncbi:MAG: TM0106 family RecB-like putative nuclease [Acidimicrobiia bacterium]
MSTASPHGNLIMIGGGELGRCPTRIHHDRFNATERADDPVVQRRIADGRAWENIVVARVLEGTDPAVVSQPGEPIDPDVPVTIASGVTAAEREAITLEALRAGVPIIVGGRLAEESLQSVGAPDLLIKLHDGYAPIDVKHHKAIGRSGIPARATSIDHLDDTNGAPVSFRSGRVNDLFQVAHYWRLLDHHGFANLRHLGGVIGAENTLLAVWVDLGAGDPSILGRQHDALNDAIRVAEAGRIQPTRPLIPPVWRGACRSCPWAEYCRDELEAIDHVSLLPAVGAHDTKRLLDSGVATTTHVAGLQPGSVHGGYEVSEEAILQARARASGSLLRRTGVDLTLPFAANQIDFDVETYLGTLYLAGLLVHEPDGAAFRPISNWTGTPAGERQVVESLFRYFDALAARGDVVVYHWTGYERTILKEASERHGLSMRSAPSVDDWFDRYACDLWSWIKQRFVSPNGYSLKVIAPLCGFDWRDDDPGGAQSELWYVDAIAGDDEQRARLLEYNEDDVAAQAAIREWVRAQPQAPSGRTLA